MSPVMLTSRAWLFGIVLFAGCNGAIPTTVGPAPTMVAGADGRDEMLLEGPSAGLAGMASSHGAAVRGGGAADAGGDDGGEVAPDQGEAGPADMGGDAGEVTPDLGGDAAGPDGGGCPSDEIPPEAGSGISFSDIGLSSVTVHWGEASDDVSAPGALAYKLVRASASSTINSVAGADQVSGSDLLLDWTAGVTEHVVTDLPDSTRFYYAVLVRDEAGNVAFYSPEGAMTLDGSAPWLGGDAFYVDWVGSNDCDLSWDEAGDAVTYSWWLQYRVVRSLDPAAIDTPEEIAAMSGADVVMDWDWDTTYTSVGGLDPDTSYYFAVAVKDISGHVAAYAPQEVHTQP